MRVLFVMRNHGYLRNYVSTIRLLAERGHQVIVASRGRERHQPVDSQSFLLALCREVPAISYERMPLRTDEWVPLASELRAARNVLRYRHPTFRKSHKLRERAEAHAVKHAPHLARLLPRGRLAASAVSAVLGAMEHTVPTAAKLDAWLEKLQPDAMVVTPLVDFNSSQIDHVKGAKAKGIPVALAVASWDNLTNKGVIAVPPDRVLVWNQPQADEAVTLHGTPRAHVRVTGAPLFDEWFEARPSGSREDFCHRIGLDPGRPYILYLCSSGFIAPEEVAYVDRWISALRSAAPGALRDCGVLIRPHPGTAAPWQDVDFSHHSGVSIWPRQGAFPLLENTKHDYFDSLHHAAAVAGINTSGMIEAGIVGRRSFTVLEPAFAETQEGAVHFHHLSRDGFLAVATSLDEHHRQLATELEQPSTRDSFAPFLTSFVRPHGLDAAATPRLVGEIEALAELHPAPTRRGRFGRLVADAARAALVPHAQPHSQETQ
jgi:hypothetical protein